MNKNNKELNLRSRILDLLGLNKASEEKNSVYTSIQNNSDWLQPLLHRLSHPSQREKESLQFALDIDNMISTHEVQEKYEETPEQAIYLTWINMLDPKIDQAAKENLCLELAQYYEDKHQKLGRALSDMPPIISAPILLYSPTKTILAYHNYQKKYGEFSQELCDKNFETTLKCLVHNNVFPKQAKTLFLKKITGMFKQQTQSYQNKNYLLHEAMASWEKNSSFISDLFDQELRAEYDTFKEKVSAAIENPSKDLTIQSEFGSLVFENLLLKHEYNAEKSTSIVMRLHNEKDISILAAIYTSQQLDAIDMLSRHLIQLAKETNEPDLDQFSCLFFSSCLSYLKGDAKLIAPQIAPFLSARYYALNAYAFSTIKKELFTYWMEHHPDQITAIVRAVLSKPKEFHETPIEKFFFDLFYAEMSDGFYNKLATLLTENLTPDQFIRVYSAASEKNQSKFLSALLSDKNLALAKLKVLSDIYKIGDFSVVFSRQVSGQLKVLDPALYQQATIEKLFVEEEEKDPLETDLDLLQKILANESLTHDERRSEMRRLENLHTALHDKKTDACPTVIKMFEEIPQKYWPDLFTYFDAAVIHWSFPQDKRHLDLFYPDKEQRPEPRKNTWLSHQAEWETILYGTLVALLPDLSKDDFGLRASIASWALSALDEAFTKSSTYFPGMVETLLKKFFLENAPDSINVFTAFQDKFSDKYHAPQYFSQKEIFNRVASWLPNDVAERATLLAKLLQFGNHGFEQALRSPFARNQEEITQTALRLINTRTEHIVNLFQRLSGDIVDTLFKHLYQFDEKGFLMLLQTALCDLSKSHLPLPDYIRLAVKLLSLSNRAHIDIFQIIDADPNKSFLLKACGDIKNWELSKTFPYPYRLIFNIVQHYEPEQLQKTILEHLQENIKKKDLFSLCDCISDAEEVTRSKLFLPKPEEDKLVDYLKQEMTTLNYFSQTTIKIMVRFIPNFDTLFLELLAKEMPVENKLAKKHQENLDNLVRVYGFSHVNALCLTPDLTKCSAYLVEKFSHFPEILQQIDEAMKSCHHILDQYQYKVDDLALWRFNDELRSTIIKAAKESKTKTFEINVRNVCEQTGIVPELAALMPPLTIKSSRTDEDELQKAVSKINDLEINPKNTTSLMIDSWEKSGLIKSLPSPITTPSEVESQKKQRLF